MDAGREQRIIRKDRIFQSATQRPCSRQRPRWRTLLQKAIQRKEGKAQGGRVQRKKRTHRIERSII